MAQFRIGDKARLVNVRFANNSKFHCCEGDEVTVIGALGAFEAGYYEISRPPNFPHNLAGFRYVVYPHELAPLTDPSADQFIARIKKLATEPVNDAPKVAVRDGA